LQPDKKGWKTKRGALPGSKLVNDRRLERLRQALEVLQDKGGGRAERIQQLISLEYDPGWERPQPR